MGLGEIGLLGTDTMTTQICVFELFGLSLRCASGYSILPSSFSVTLLRFQNLPTCCGRTEYVYMFLSILGIKLITRSIPSEKKLDSGGKKGGWCKLNPLILLNYAFNHVFSLRVLGKPHSAMSLLDPCCTPCLVSLMVPLHVRSDFELILFPFRWVIFHDRRPEYTYYGYTYKNRKLDHYSSSRSRGRSRW